MMKIDPKKPYAMKPKKIDNEMGIYNADYENFIHLLNKLLVNVNILMSTKVLSKVF